jgi:hypothetical protein
MQEPTIRSEANQSKVMIFNRLIQFNQHLSHRTDRPPTGQKHQFLDLEHFMEAPPRRATPLAHLKSFLITNLKKKNKFKMKIKQVIF